MMAEKELRTAALATQFNPYHEWLQLDEQIERPSYYELLGIKSSVTDEKVIAAAADRAASRVRSHRPGAHAAEWAQLLDEIAAAKQCLLDPTARRQYDRDISGSSAERPKVRAEPAQVTANRDLYPPGIEPQSTEDSKTPKTKVSAENSDAPNRLQRTQPIPLQLPAPLPIDSESSLEAMQPWVRLSDSVDPMAPLVAEAELVPYLKPIDSDNLPAANPMAPLAAMAAEPPVAASEPILAAVTSSRRTHDDGKTTVWVKPVLMGIAAGFVLLVGVMIFRNVNAPETKQVAKQPAVPTDSIGPAAEAGSSPADENANKDSLENVAIAPVHNAQQILSPLADPKTVLPTVDERDEAIDQTAMPVMPPQDSTKVADSKAEDVTEPAPKPSVVDAKEAKPAVEAKPATEQAASPTTTEPSKPTITKQELTKLGRAMQKTRDAIADHEFDLAAEFLAIAATMPQLPEHTAKLDRLNLLLDAVKQYRQAIDASVSKLEVGVTFDVNSTVVGIVEASREKVVFRSAGRSLGYSIPELPPALAAVLAEQTLDVKDSATLMMKGAFIISSRKATPADRTKARGFLDDAAASNDTAKALLPILEDSYDLSKDAT